MKENDSAQFNYSSEVDQGTKFKIFAKEQLARKIAEILLEDDMIEFSDFTPTHVNARCLIFGKKPRSMK